jgi:hypothetical protein
MPNLQSVERRVFRTSEESCATDYPAESPAASLTSVESERELKKGIV